MLRVYLLHTDELKDLAVNEDLFSAQRKEKIQKLKHEDDKQLSKGVELLLMYGLKQIDPSVHFPLSIKEEESGNLLLENQLDPPVFFNLSHAKEYAACAIADKPVGIDVECVKTREVQHMDRILHPQEVMIQGFITNVQVNLPLMRTNWKQRRVSWKTAMFIFIKRARLKTLTGSLMPAIVWQCVQRKKKRMPWCASSMQMI